MKIVTIGFGRCNGAPLVHRHAFLARNAGCAGVCLFGWAAEVHW